MQIHIHHHPDCQTQARLGRLERMMGHILRGQQQMAKTLDEMIAQGRQTLDQIKQNTSLDQSIIALVQGHAQQITDLRAQLAAAGTDPARLAELGEVMDALSAAATAEGQASADAVTANTPAG